MGVGRLESATFPPFFRAESEARFDRTTARVGLYSRKSCTWNPVVVGSHNCGTSSLITFGVAMSLALRIGSEPSVKLRQQ